VEDPIAIPLERQPDIGLAPLEHTSSAGGLGGSGCVQGEPTVLERLEI
jgi:hypothetical protein